MHLGVHLGIGAGGVTKLLCNPGFILERMAVLQAKSKKMACRKEPKGFGKKEEMEGWSNSFEYAVGAIAKYWKHDV